jgi:hypothetical protein
MSVVGRISGWIGLASHQADIEPLQREGTLWMSLALGLPLVSAFVLTLGRREPPTSGTTLFPNPRGLHWFLTTIVCYGGNLLIAILGTLGFALVLALVGWVLWHLGVGRHN